MGTQKKRAVLSVVLLLILLGSAVGYTRWRRQQAFVETEDAYVKGSIHTIAPRIPGSILTVDIQENQKVRAGQVIVSLDPRDYDAAVAKAQVSLTEAAAQLAANQAFVAQAEAQVEAAESQLHLAQIEKGRLAALYQQHSMTRQEYDRAASAEQVAQAQAKAARRAVATAEAQVEVSKWKVEVSRASLETAGLQRSYCTITSPVDGEVSRKMAEVGEVVAPGQPLCAVVPLGLGEIWVEANYRETQIRNVRPGQRARFRADIDRGTEYAGMVESLSAGTGAAFSLFPPENATGNWVKVVQRVPVKIRIEPGSDPDHKLRLGLSVTVSIDTRNR